MPIHETRFGRSISLTLIASMLTMSMPFGAFAAENPAPLESKLATPGRCTKQAVADSKNQDASSRKLTSSEIESMSGRLGENPYVAGSQKFAVQVAGVDLLTGNFSTSATDLNFEGGYGIPVAVSRVYSANNADEGPLGKGWSLSADIRTTAGGVIKSGGSPVRSVPITYKPKPTSADDPRIPTDPPEAVIAVDASAYEQTIQRDVDGVLSTPAWDKNQTDTEYEYRSEQSQVWELPNRIVTTTPEGTVYVYEKMGTYSSPYYCHPPGTTTAGESANVLYIKTVTDRHGNTTTYNYSTDYVTLNLRDGDVSVKKLTGVTMPNGWALTFTWGDNSTDSYGYKPTNRIVSASDGTRTVNYRYDSTYKLLTYVRSPQGRVTTMTYGTAAVPSGWGTAPVAGGLLDSVTDPRGMTSDIDYEMGYAMNPPYTVTTLPTPRAKLITAPNGVETHFSWSISFGGSGGAYGRFTQKTSGGTAFNDGELNFSPPESSGTTFQIRMRNALGVVTPGMGERSPYWERIYNLRNFDLLEEYVHQYPVTGNNSSQGLEQSFDRKFPIVEGNKRIYTTTSYNFMGNPLVKTVKEQHPGSGSSWVDSRTTTSEFAYWDKTKYFQQKATKDNAGRQSYTDYYSSTASTGKGLAYKVFDNRSAWVYATSGVWRTLAPNDTNKYTAKFEYDAKGRPTNIWKLRAITSGTYSWVETQTSYNSDSSPGWGLPSTVTEDYGSGKINRTTTTSAYDSAGRATLVQDAAGKVFATTYSLDGQILNVKRTDPNPDVDIVTYTYGTTGIENAMPTEIVDNQSGATQTMTYLDDPGEGGHGQIEAMEEYHEIGTTYIVYNTYNGAGDRTHAQYETPNGTTQWRYSNYVPVGFPEQGARAFETLTKQTYSSGWSDTSEQMHYLYDSMGRLLFSAFAQTPQSGQSGYPDTHPAARRVVSGYIYDDGGRLTELSTWCEKYVSSAFTPMNPDDVSGTIQNSGLAAKSVYTYDSTLGLRSTARIYQYNNDGTLNSDRTQSYSYDSNLDYLTSCAYTGTGGSSTSNWYYDAAGNRFTNSGLTDHTYDNVNRMTISPSKTYTNDILGNRTWRNQSSTSAVRLIWDDTNRLKQVGGPSAGANYKYRADGMRIKKVSGYTVTFDEQAEEESGAYDDDQAENYPTTRYFYDGQMGFEEDYTEDNTHPVADVHTVTRYGLGARGIDLIQNLAWSGSTLNETALSFPLYDGHGSMISTISRSGTAFAKANGREYDPWGLIRSGATSGDPSQRYCANLGHREDDESGLTYMRARYYEPTTGRFISEDPAMDGANWFVYAANSPSVFVDPSGNKPLHGNYYFDFMMFCGMSSFSSALILLAPFAGIGPSVAERTAAYALIGFAAFNFSEAIGETSYSSSRLLKFMGAVAAFSGLIAAIAEGAKQARLAKGFASVAIMAAALYSTMVLGLIIMGDPEG